MCVCVCVIEGERKRERRKEEGNTQQSLLPPQLLCATVCIILSSEGVSVCLCVLLPLLSQTIYLVCPT